MTQPPTPPTPPAGGPPPAAGGFAPPAGPQGYAVPPQPGPHPMPPSGPYGVPPQPGPYGVPPQPGPHGGPPQPGPYAGLPRYPAGPPRPGFPGVPVSPGGQPLASFGDRLLAVLIDSLVLGGASLVVVIPAFVALVTLIGPDLDETNPDGTPASDPFTDFLLPLLGLQAGLFLFAFAVSYLYHVEVTLRRGQTIGKQVMKLKIVPIDPARTLDRKMATRRWLAYQVGGTVIPGFSYVDGLWQLWDKPWQQCLHDKFADTVVVKVSG